MSLNYWDEALIHVRIHLTGFSGEQNIFETKMHTVKAKCSEGRKVFLQVRFVTLYTTTIIEVLMRVVDDESG